MIPRAYFAYSPLMDPAAFEAWKQKHDHAAFQLPKGEVGEAVDVDLVFDFHSIQWGGRIASLTKRPGRSVFGLLYQLRPEAWPIIQQAEGGRGGKFVELAVQVRAAGRLQSATAFASHPDRRVLKGPVSESYAEALARAAEAAKLPQPYVLRLKAEAEILKRVQAAGRDQGLPLE